MSTLRIKKGDLVKVVAGAHKGKTAKVEKTDAVKAMVYLEGIGSIKRHVRPNRLQPRGGTKEIHKGLPLSNVALVIDEAKNKTSRVGYKLNKEGNKTRIAKKSGKEIA